MELPVWSLETAKARSDATALECLDESRTIQSGKEDSDINVIMERYVRYGTVPQIGMPPLSGDFSEVVDFRGAQDLIVQARNSFMALPAKVRETFHNDPAAFVDFCEDPDNLPKLRKWGLAVPREDDHGGSGGRVDSDARGAAEASGRVAEGDGAAARGAAGD